ncbi:MAG: MarR family transcriptional regulator [Firmicutes bacterium]|nr:MarR family transcriptional regulator [Bacillota bacterium]
MKSGDLKREIKMRSNEYDKELNDIVGSVLNTWVRFEGVMRTTMMSGSLTHREFAVCNMIENSTEPVTATELCEKLAMHKSQMNRTLSELEKMGIITRERSVEDKRKVYIRLNKDGADAYYDMNGKALAYTEAVVENIGTDRLMRIKDAFSEVSDALSVVTKPEREKE